jgi:hypothetical protein
MTDKKNSGSWLLPEKTLLPMETKNVEKEPLVNSGGVSSATAQRWNNQPEPLCTKTQVAERLQVSLRSVESLMKIGAIPFFRLPKNILRFRWNDVAAALRFFEKNALSKFDDDLIDMMELPRYNEAESVQHEFAKIVPAVFSGQENEVLLTPAELLEIARSVGAFAQTILITEVASAADLSDEERRSERTAFARRCEKANGHSFADGVQFNSTGYGHTRRYKFTRPAQNKEFQP